MVNSQQTTSTTATIAVMGRRLPAIPRNPVRHVVDLDVAQRTDLELAALERFGDARLAAQDR
jgi:hypothetical protein